MNDNEIVLTKIKNSFTEALDALTRLANDESAPFSIRQRAATALFELAEYPKKKDDGGPPPR